MTTQLISAVLVSITSALMAAVLPLLSGRAARVSTAVRRRAGKGRGWLPYLVVLAVGAAVGALVGRQLEGREEARGRIVSPDAGAVVAPDRLAVSGTLSAIPEDRHVWIAVQRDDSLFPKVEVPSRDTRWTRIVSEAGPAHTFALVLVMVDRGGQRAIERWLAEGARTGSFPAFERPGKSRQLDVVDVVQRAAVPAPAALPTGRILSPRPGARVAEDLLRVRGTVAAVPSGDHVWLAVERGGALFPKEPEVPARGTGWKVRIVEPGPAHAFSIVLLVVGSAGHREIVRWLAQGRRSGSYPPLATIPGSRRLDSVAVVHR